MLYLIGSVVLTSYLTLAFKMCEKYRVNIFQAIIFNYITCVITGSIVNGSFPVNADAIRTPWFQWACVMGVLFISIFNVVGLTTQKIGVAVASVANKLSLIIPVVLSVYLYNETVEGWKLAGCSACFGGGRTYLLPGQCRKKNRQSSGQVDLPVARDPVYRQRTARFAHQPCTTAICY
jgi:drug/metabolite transporter (DMT)-like permease